MSGPWKESTSASWKHGLTTLCDKQGSGLMVAAEWAGEGARREAGPPGCDPRPSRFLFMAITITWPCRVCREMDSCVCAQNREVPDVGEHDSLYHSALLRRSVEWQGRSQACRWPVPGSCSYQQGAGWLAAES